jgi:hypothetical protein
MRSVAEYLARAAEFDDLARSTSEPSLQKRYTDMAECYRLLAEERQRLITEGTIESDLASAVRRLSNRLELGRSGVSRDSRLHFNRSPRGTGRPDRT